MRDDGDPLIGAAVGGRYVVLGFLGEGGAARVYRAHDRVLARPCALKVPLAPGAHPRLGREARAGARIAAPGVVKVHDAGALADGRPYIVFEYLDGETLGECLRKGALAPGDVLAIAREVAVALAAAHAAGVVHRDVKPDNVLLSPSGGVRLIDFGCARMDGERPLTRPDERIGTPLYMAPEQRVAPAAVDGRADLYSLGVTLFVALAGAAAVSDVAVIDDATGAIRLDARAVRRRLAHLPRAVARLVVGMTTRHPLRRIGSAEEVAAALDDCIVRLDGTVEEHVVPPPPRPRRTGGRLRHKGVAAYAGAAMAMAALVVRVIWWSAPSLPPITAEAPAVPAIQQRAEASPGETVPARYLVPGS